MKVAISTDEILHRDSSTDILDTFLDFFDRAEVFTLAHKPHQVLGPVELRKVHASFLSHKVKAPEDLKKNCYLVPAASKKLFVPCSTDLLVSFSRGLGHAVSRCEKTRQLLYIHDLKNLPQGRNWREKFFRSYVHRWSMKNLNTAYEVWCSSETFKKYLEEHLDREIKVVRPFINLHEFPPIPENVYPHDFYVVNAEGLDLRLAGVLMRVLAERGLPYRFVGEDWHLEELKSEEKVSLFAGPRCGGELAPMLSACRGLIDLSSQFESMPQICLQTLSSGRPVVSIKSEIREEFLPNKGRFLASDELLSRDITESEMAIEIHRVLDLLDTEFQSFKAAELHQSVKSFHKAGFQGHIKRFVSKIS